jgi:hypothetical protein
MASETSEQDALYESAARRWINEFGDLMRDAPYRVQLAAFAMWARSQVPPPSTGRWGCKVSKAAGVCLCIDRNGWDGGLQVSVDFGGSGYRLCGPKYNGSSTPVIRHKLTQRDCDELERAIALARAQFNPAPLSLHQNREEKK